MPELETRIKNREILWCAKLPKRLLTFWGCGSLERIKRADVVYKSYGVVPLSRTQFLKMSEITLTLLDLIIYG